MCYNVLHSTLRIGSDETYAKICGLVERVHHFDFVWLQPVLVDDVLFCREVEEYGLIVS